MRRRLNIKTRKQEILEAAKEIFLVQGFAKTTMEDIIKATTLSKGGFYYYYKNTKDIMFDLFVESNQQRIQIMLDYLAAHHLDWKDLNDVDLLAELLTTKVLDRTPMMMLYAMFLVEVNYDPSMKQLFERISQQTIHDINRKMPNELMNGQLDETQQEFFVGLINTFILGTCLIDQSGNFPQYRPLFKEMIKLALQYFRQA